MNEAVTPMCSPELCEGNPPVRAPSDVLNHTLIHDETLVRHWPDTPAWSTWLALAGLPDRDVRAGPRFDHSDHCLDAAIEGSGIVLGRRAMASRDLEQGRLVAPFDIDLPFRGGIYCVTTETKAANPDVAAFRAWLRAEAARTPMGAVGTDDARGGE